MVQDLYLRPANQYPRMTLHCLSCGNEFNISATRLREDNQVACQICGQVFPTEYGLAFYKALGDMFAVKHKMDEAKADGQGFEISFMYKSTFKQPPAPLAFDVQDFEVS